MAKKKRDEFSVAVKRTLRDRVAGRCSQPSCRKLTVGPEISSEEKAVVTGNAAHICAASEEGPRFDASQTPKERVSIHNGIWLCAGCASLIDKNGGAGYSIDTLRSWKESAEKRTYDELISSSVYQRPAWLERFSTIHFANVPRLAQMLSSGDFPERLVHVLGDGFPTQGMIARELYTLEKAIQSAMVEAVPLEHVTPPSDDIIGCVVSFFQNCRTKNGVIDKNEIDGRWIREFDDKKSPHFYIKIGETKFIFPYDPRWITTNTAYSEFRSGTRKFAGIGIVKHVSDDLSGVIVSPLLVGLARHPSMDDFF
tara:strand:+ start:6552 stop:7484 length:933 start_codon:yes stop_codon:yes gene_type:complete